MASVIQLLKVRGNLPTTELLVRVIDGPTRDIDTYVYGGMALHVV